MARRGGRYKYGLHILPLSGFLVKDGLLIREQISVRSGYTIVGTFADAAVPTATFRTKVWPATGIIFEQAGQSTRHSRLARCRDQP